MNHYLELACTTAGKAWRPMRDVWTMMTVDLQNTIIDQYKGMEIRIRARRWGRNAWRCTIRIADAPHFALQTVAATLRATEEGVSRQTAMASAFIEAMSLCDLILEKKKSL